MKKIRNIINSSTPPSTDSIWLNGQSALYYTDGKWTQVGASPEKVTSIINNNAVDRLAVRASGYYVVGSYQKFTEMNAILAGINGEKEGQGENDWPKVGIFVKNDSGLENCIAYIQRDGKMLIENLTVENIALSTPKTMATLATSATLADVITKVNAIISTFKTMGIFK